MKLSKHIDQTTLNNFLVANFSKFSMDKKIGIIKVSSYKRVQFILSN